MTYQKGRRTSQALAGAGNAIEERFGGAAWARKSMRKAFPDHWSFLLGEIALYAFVILILTGVFLTLFFVPSMDEVVYDGSYTKLRGVEMSQAYESALHITFDVRGGLLVRQIHHWATILFLAAITLHLLRHFFTGSFRKPREFNWLVGIVLFMLVMVNGLFGYSLPDDLLSGTGIRILEGVLLGIPVIGTYTQMWLFGGEFPGELIISRLYVIHILLIPGILAALIPLHGILMTWRVMHTTFPGKGATNRTQFGYPFFPVFIAKTTAWFIWVFAVCVVLATLFQINPIWLYGPYDPGAISSGSQPDWYMGWLEGALRMMPAWELNAWGHTIPFSVLIPSLAIPGLLFTGLALYPFLERWVTGDHAVHNLLDRPRDVPARTGIGAGGVVWFGVLLAGGGNDVIADKFDIPLYWTTWFFRITFILGPILAYLIAYRICLGLQRRDLALVEHGVETGIIVRSPNGEYTEAERHLRPEEAAPITDERPPPAIALAPPEHKGVQSRKSPLQWSKVRLTLNRHFIADAAKRPVPPDSHGNGREAQEPKAVKPPGH